MADDDDYTEALASDDSEPASEPGQSDVGHDDSRNPEDAFESAAPASLTRRAGVPRPQRTAAGRAAFAEAAAKFKAEKAAAGEEDEGDFGPYDEGATPAPKRKADAVASTPVVAAAPPAPALDPEVRALREEARAEREKQRAATAEVEKRRAESRGPIEHEAYLESPTKAYRGWLEAMRGQPMTDDEFRQEAADFVTLTSGEVLGVKLPDDVRARIDTRLVKTALVVGREKQSKQQQAETARQEASRVDAEWKDAERTLDGHFKSEKTMVEAYPWLAAEESPGYVIVDVIKSVQRRDGTKLSWQEAAKQANDYLKKQASGYYDKRKHLLGSAQPAAPAVKQEARPGRPPGTQQVTRAPVTPPPSQPTSELPVARRANRGWSAEAHRRETRAAFAPQFKPEE